MCVRPHRKMGYIRPLPRDVSHTFTSCVRFLMRAPLLRERMWRLCGSHATLNVALQSCCDPSILCAMRSTSSAATGDLNVVERAIADIRAVLRRVGPVPISKLSSYLSDDTLEAASKHEGGVAGLCRATSSVFIVVTLPENAGVHVVLCRENYTRVPHVDRQAVTFITAVLAANTHQGRVQCGKRMLNSTPTVSELFNFLPLAHQQALRHVNQLDRFIRMYSNFFLVDGLGKVQLVKFGKDNTGTANVAFKRESAMVLSDAGEVNQITNPRIAKFKRLLSITTPQSFFVPLTYILKQRAIQMVFEPNVSLSDVMTTLQELPKGFIDVRCFGPSLQDVYIRLLSQQQLDHGAVICKAEILAVRYCITTLGQRVVTEFGAYLKANSAHRLRFLKGIHMNELPEILSSGLMADLYELYPTTTVSSGEAITKDVMDGGPKGKDARVLILLFDRLRHVFDVNFSLMAVRPWSVLPPEDQPSSLTADTTPLPLVLKYAQIALDEEPLSTVELYRRLPRSQRQQLLATYLPPARSSPVLLDKEEAENTDVGDIVKAMRAFLTQHSLFLFYRGDKVYTPLLAAGEAKPPSQHERRRRQKTSFSDLEKAELLHSSLPAGQPVEWSTFMGHQSIRDLPFDVRDIRQDFFIRHSSFMQLYEPFCSPRVVIGRSDTPPPSPEVLQPRLNSLEAVVKFLALHSVGGAFEGTVMSSLSKEGRAYMKSIGTFADLAEQLPMWFEVKRSAVTSESTLITYIGTTAPTLGSDKLPKLRLKVNDASLADDEDKWHSDWDENVGDNHCRGGIETQHRVQ